MRQCGNNETRPEAFEAMKPFLLENYGNASQPYSFSRIVKKALKEARHRIAQCINADDDEIFFTSGGTESDNWAIKGSMSYGDTKTVITSQIEHHAILNACAAVERFGYPVAYLPVDKTGIVQPDTLKSFISPKTKLVSIMTANNEIGSIQPIQELCSIAHQNGAVFHTDAVQAVGHINIDVKALGIAERLTAIAPGADCATADISNSSSKEKAFALSTKGFFINGIII
nr:cysteine desulfurase [uncultured bacterium]